jgi:hypothetical protein
MYYLKQVFKYKDTFIFFNFKSLYQKVSKINSSGISKTVWAKIKLQ